MRRWTLVRRAVIPGAILAYACILRVVFFSGFVLCDDRQEFWTVQQILANGPVYTDQFQVRFGGWFFNVLAFRLFGVSEASFFLPTLLMSASLALVGYVILLAWRYRAPHAAAAALMIASAPFEVLVGTLRANDVFLAWSVGIGILALAALDRWPSVQGVCVAVLFWFAFYVKLWVVYLLPVLGVYYVLRALKDRRWRGGVAFIVCSLVLHGATCLFWKSHTGYYVPFIRYHAATYPWARADLPVLFRQYPHFLFRGSEFGTTLFGSVPYLVLLMLLLKVGGTLLGTRYRFDARDWALFGAYASFFLLLNFFPNSFSFDRYYSAPRIFRYLSPMSFPMTLHLAKMLLDLSPVVRPALATWVPIACLVGLTAVNVAQAGEAAGPSVVYRQRLMAAVHDIRERHPPKLVSEDWLSFFLTNVYLKDLRGQVEVVSVPPKTYAASQYEAWLRSHQSALPAKTVLLTGIASCVHYGAHRDGFRLAYFARPLDPAWKLVNDYGPLTYLPVAEPARLWELAGPMAVADVASGGDGDDSRDEGQRPEELFQAGMAKFDGGDYAAARSAFQRIMRRYPTSPVGADAWYFDTICAFRGGEWRETIAGFDELVRRFPASVWVPGAHYHTGVAYAALGDAARARERFEYVRAKFPQDNVASLATERLAEIERDSDTGLLVKLWRKLRAALPSS